MLETSKWSAHLVVNRGPNTLQGQLIQGLKPAERADFAVAFISLAGLKRILPKLRQVARRGGVRIITGLYQDVTEPAALRKLLSVSNETGGRLSIRISRNHRFHMKLYLLTLRKRMTALIGSSNLSNDGLLNDGELVMSLSVPADAAPMKQLISRFDAIWKRQTVGLTPGLIQRYAARHSLLKKHGRPAGLPSLAEILRAGKTREGGGDESEGSTRWWRDSISRCVQAKTELIIAEETDWDTKRWMWYSPGANPYRIHDFLTLLDFEDGLAYIAEVVDTTECPTPDGRHFVACRILKTFRKRKMTQAFWTEMKDHGIVTSKAYEKNPRKLLSKSLQECVRNAFRKR